jgi:hypothetical protein
MPALRELQRSFAAALFAGEPDEVFGEIAAPGGEIDDRFDIYRNNVRAGFAKALAVAFPVIERLMGERYFQHIAEELRLAHPSRAGDLHHIGAPFPAFLRRRFGETQYSYFADVAELEWAYQESLIAADASPIRADVLRQIDPSSYEGLRFTLDPAVRLVHSDYPIVRIWSANQPEASADELIDLDRGGDDVLVLRTSEHIELHRLPPGEFAGLRAIAAGFPLGTALEAALIADAEFDLAAALQRFFRLNLFTSLTAPADLPA